MKRVLGTMLVGMLLLGTMAAFAGEGCCGAGGTGKVGTNFTANNSLAKLNLTDEQKSKVDAVVAECKTSGCTAAAIEKMTAGLKTILTPEQYTSGPLLVSRPKLPRVAVHVRSLQKRRKTTRRARTNHTNAAVPFI